MAGLPDGGGDVVDNYKDQVPASVSTAIAAAWQQREVRSELSKSTNSIG